LESVKNLIQKGKNMKTILHFSASIVVALLLCLSVVAQSQSTTGLIQGNVVDQNGAVIQGATVVVKNTETGFERTVTSNSDGFLVRRCCRSVNIK